MTNLPNLAKLIVPEQQKVKSWFDIRPKKIALWIDALPLANADETAKQLFSALSHINRIKISVAARVKAMESLYDTYQSCVNTLKTNFIGQSFPLNSRTLKQVDRSIAIHSEWSIGYKIAASELLQRNRFYEHKNTAAAIFHAMKALDSILLIHYQIYAPEPALLWNDIHTLYYLAEEKDLLKQNIESEDLNNKNTSTIESKYKETLLLSLSNPYHSGK